MSTWTVYVDNLNPYWPEPAAREGHHLFDLGSTPYGTTAYLVEADTEGEAVRKVLDGRRQTVADRLRST